MIDSVLLRSFDPLKRLEEATGESFESLDHRAVLAELTTLHRILEAELDQQPALRPTYTPRFASRLILSEECERYGVIPLAFASVAVFRDRMQQLAADRPWGMFGALIVLETYRTVLDWFELGRLPAMLDGVERRLDEDEWDDLLTGAEVTVDYLRQRQREWKTRPTISGTVSVGA